MDHVKHALLSALRTSYPNGHPLFPDLTLHELELHDQKNHDYAHGGHPLGNFLRVSHILKLYPGLDLTDPAMVALVYMLKQVDAYLWIKSQRIETRVEGIQARLQDVSVYAKLLQCIEADTTQPSSEPREPHAV